MAPEQWDGMPVSPAADIYAATAVFFECLTGMTPFSGGLGQLAAQHAAAAVPVGLVDEPLRALIARGMAKDPAARPASAAALVTELEATAAAAYGPDWEARGRVQLAGRAAALLLLLLHGPATAVASGTGTTTATTTLAPKAAVASHAGLNGWQLAALSVAVCASVAAGVAGAGALASRGHPAAAPARAAAATTRTAPSAKPATTPPSCGTVLSADGGSGDPRIAAIARETLTAACEHDAAAIDRLLGPTGSVPAVNKILARPGAYQQIITILARTHGVSQDGYSIWPGFTFTGTTGDPAGAADAKALGVTSTQEYTDHKGIIISIGDAYTAKPYIPALGISQSGP